jgi:ATP-binding cassette subfamily B protein
MRSIDEFTWPLARLGEGIEELARRAGLCRASPETLAPPPSITPAHSTDLGRWIEWAGGRLGIEAEAVETTYAEVDALIEGAGPAVIALRGGGELRFLMVMRPGKGQVRLLTPDLGARSCSVQLIRDAVCAGLEAPLAREIDQLLTRAKVPARSRPRAQRSMIDERLGSHPVGECWVLRPAPAASFFGQLAQARLPRRVWGVLGLFAIVYLLEILGWGLIGEAAMNGRLDMGWLGAWVLLLVTLVPLRLLAEWLDATFALDAGRVLKKRLLAGALNLDIEAVRHQGAGRLLGRVMESQALESLALNGGLTVLVSALELSFAVSILAIGAGGSLHLILAGVWTLLTIGLSLRYHRRLREWILTRLAMTHDLIEQMVGHRTRLAQEWPQHRGQSEDQALKEYLDRSRKLDATVIPIAVVMPTGWTLLGLLGLAPAFVAGTAEPSSLAIGLGGIMLANRAFGGISGGLAGLARAVIAWEQVAPLFRAGGLAGTPAAFLPSIDPTGVPVAMARATSSSTPASWSFATAPKARPCCAAST